MLVLGCAVVLALALSAQAGAAGVKLNYYRATVSQDVYRDLRAKGTDIAAATDVAKGVRLELVLTPSQVRALKTAGCRRIPAPQHEGPDGAPGGRRPAFERLQRLARLRRSGRHPGRAVRRRSQNPQLAKLKVIGTTGQGREIIALKLTQGARGVATAHGRRCSTARRSTRASGSRLRSTAACCTTSSTSWRANNKAIKDCSRRTSSGSCSSRTRTATSTRSRPRTRLWRKTLRDNNGNGTIKVGDGVDPNRNYPEHWDYDEEGSSSVPSSDTYRGPAAASEPETQAMMRPLRPGRLRVPRQLPLVRPVAPLPGGLADRNADRRRPDLLRALRQPGQPGHRRTSTPGSRPTCST